jgi:predicted metal-dependent phosphoesterase TrpH
MMRVELLCTPFLRIDLHTHSTCSDGCLGPADLVGRAADRRVELLAITDHDDVSGLHAGYAAAKAKGMHFVPGVEISVSWSGQSIHVLGLGIDPECAALARGLSRLRSSRESRSVRIAAALDALGIPGTLEGAARHASNPATIGRGHFARYLVEIGLARNVQAVFKRYLAAGKPGFVPHEWVDLHDAVGWISAAGGVAVLAHPERYGMSRARLRALLQDFRNAGGVGLEIGSDARANPLPRIHFAREQGFAISVGSDFHAPAESSVDIGDTVVVPPGTPVVWENPQCFRAAA